MTLENLTWSKFNKYCQTEGSKQDLSINGCEVRYVGYCAIKGTYKVNPDQDQTQNVKSFVTTIFKQILEAYAYNRQTISLLIYNNSIILPSNWSGDVGTFCLK